MKIKLSQELLHHVFGPRAGDYIQYTPATPDTNMILDALTRAMNLFSDFTDQLPENGPSLPPALKPYTGLSFILDRNSGIVHLNTDAAGLLHCPVKEAYHKPFTHLLADNSPVSRDEIRHILKQAEGSLLCALCFRTPASESIPALALFFIHPRQQDIRITAVAFTRGRPVFREVPTKLLKQATRDLSVYRETVPENHQKYIGELVTYLRAHSDKPLPSINQLSRTLGVNRTRLMTMFKEQTGKTIGQYHDDLRMARVRELLQTTGLPHAEIAVKLRFKSVTGLYRAVKRKYGYTPGQLRKEG